MVKKLRIISYNICALPKWFNIYGNPLKRISKIIDILDSIDADIICLQELFDRKIIEIVKQSMIKYNFFYKKSTSKLFLNSGLMILSKYTIINSGYETFSNHCGEDSLATKGIIFSNIIFNNKIITIINTHLNADSIFSTKYRCRNIRLKQIGQIINNIKKTHHTNNIILCGDLNMIYSHNTHFLNKLKNSYKYCICSNNTLPKLITHRKNKTQIDYIYYLYNEQQHIEYKYDTYISEQSDHNAIILEIIFM